MATLKESEFFNNSDGLKLFSHVWKKEGDGWKPRALVFIAHGAGEHCLWYTEIAEELVSIGCLVFSHDHVGHGQSEGDRVHIDTFSTYTKDVFQHCDVKKEQNPGLPLFLIGHSMGGAIAATCAIERPKYFEGVVLIAAAVVASPEALSPFRYHMGKLVARICPQFPVICLDTDAVSRDPAALYLATIMAWLWPRCPVGRLSADDVTRNETAVERYKNDPLVWHGGLKAKWGICMLEAMNYIQDNMEAIDWPVFILHGDADRICDVSGSQQMDEKIKSKDKTLKVYKGFYHQLHSEPAEDGEMVRRDIKEWIEQRMLGTVIQVEHSKAVEATEVSCGIKT